jgi:hypothetical protein
MTHYIWNQDSDHLVSHILCYMHQINIVVSFNILPVWKVLKKIWLLLESFGSRSWSFLSLLSLYYSLSKYNLNVFTISNIFFPVYRFEALSFSTVLSKYLFILRYLCSLQEPSMSHEHQFSRWKVNWYSSIHTNRRFTLCFSFPWYCKAPESIMDANKYDCF